MSRQVLLVTHDASRTGAPMIALLVARCLVDQGDALRVTSRREGPLLADFAAIAPTNRELLHRVRRRLWETRARRLAWLIDVLAATATLLRHRPDLIYVNSSAAAIYLHAARWLRVPALLHVHESDANTGKFLADARVSDLTGVTLVACSPQVERDLLARTRRTPDSGDGGGTSRGRRRRPRRLPPPSVQSPGGWRHIARTTMRTLPSPATLRAKPGLGRPPGGVHLLLSVPDADRLRALAAGGEADPGTASPLVGAIGSAGHRKGTDLWLRVAEIVQDECDARFVWIGECDGLTDQYSRKIGQIQPYWSVTQQVGPGIDFTGPMSNPYPAMAGLDVATLPSRDDPFPLVVIESMLLGKPVVAFDVGSVRDQIGDGGIVVPPEDVDAFAAAVVHLLTDHATRAALGAAAQARAERLFSSDAFAGRLREISGRQASAESQGPRMAARQSR